MLRKTDVSLKDRIIKSPGHYYAPASQPRPHKYHTQVDRTERFTKALNMVRDGVSVRRAAESFNIPKSTLHDHVTGKVLALGQSGPPKYLIDDEEEELEEFLSGCASVGFARSRQQVMELVQEVVNRKGYSVHVSHGWWESLRRRHPNLVLRTASPLAYARVMGSDPMVINKYYDLLERTLADNDLVDKPAQILTEKERKKEEITKEKERRKEERARKQKEKEKLVHEKKKMRRESQTGRACELLSFVTGRKHLGYLGLYIGG